MKPFKKKAILTWLSVAFTALVAIILLLLTWFYTTESGLQWLVNRGAQFQPKALSIGKVSGTLSSRVHLSEFKWQQPETKIHVTDIVVDCQWLYLLDRVVVCDNITINAFNLSSDGDKKTDEPQAILPALNAIEFPIEIKIKQAAINTINYQVISPETTNTANNKLTVNAQYNIKQLSLKKLALAGNKASVSELTLTYDEHNLAVSGYVDMRKKWQHQLGLSVQGPKLSVNAKTKGRMSESSTLTLQLQSPNQLLVSADWYYDQGLFIKNGRLTAEKQQVALSDDNITVEKLSGKFALNWPELTANLQTTATWQAFEPISLDVNTTLDNVLNWRSHLAVSLLLKSELKEAQIADSIKQAFPDTVNHKSSTIKAAWPVLANLEMNVNQGILNLKSHEIILGELTANVQGEVNIDNPTTENLSFNGSIEGRSLDLINSLEIANIKANWQVEKQQSVWAATSEGKIEHLALPNFVGKNIDWSLDFGEKWLANVNAGSFTVNDNVVELASLNFSGLPEKHNMLVKAKLAENTDVNLTLDGKIPQENAEPFSPESNLANAIWQINNLEFKALNQKENVLITSEQLLLGSDTQRVKNLCLSGVGKLCINAENKTQQWSANLIFNQWAMSPVFKQVQAWQSILLASPTHELQSIEGTVNGNLSITGHAKKLEKFNANITIPSFKWQSAQIQLQAEEFSVNTQQKQDDIALITQWETINTQIILPQSQSEVVMPKGELVLSITPDFKVNFNLEQPDIKFNIPDEKIKADNAFSKHLLTITQFKLQGQWLQNSVSSRLNIRLPGEDEITVQLSSDWPLVDSAKISGDLSLSLKEFDWLKQWQKGLDKIDLSLVQNFTLAGTLQKPIIDGEGIVDINHLVIDEYGLDISNSKIKLSSQQDSIVLLGELQNPQGALTIAGDAKISAPIKANLTVEGQQVTLVNNNENKLIVSPMLKAKFENNHLTVNGNLVVDQADIKVASLPKSAINVSEDQVIIDENAQTVTDSPFDYDISLTLSAGDNVKISGFGLSSEIQGNLSSTLITGQALTLNGRLDLKDGKFEAYKQTLTIEQGQLLFLGTAANPSIQFRAIRMVDDIKVGIIADGTIQKPRLTLFSEPTMADENILSLLITGRNLDSLSQQEGNALTSAAISLGVESANKLVQKIGDQLGLKDVAFTSKSGSNGNSTRVDIAAKINDRLNVGYGTNIDSESGLQAGWSIEYKLSPNISFEAISGEEISANINYKKQFSTTKDKNNKKDQD